MTVLVDWEIRNVIESGELKITPYDPSLVNPASLDIRLGDRYGQVKPTGKLLDEKQGAYIDPRDKDSFTTEYFKAPEFLLPPQNSILVSMHETIEFPDYICGKIMGKSSIGRLFISNSAHVAAWIDSGWCGNLVMEISNLNFFPILLSHKMKIGQVVLFNTAKPEKSYLQTGRYVNQSLGKGSEGI